MLNDAKTRVFYHTVMSSKGTEQNLFYAGVAVQWEDKFVFLSMIAVLSVDGEILSSRKLSVAYNFNYNRILAFSQPYVDSHRINPISS